MADSSNLSCPRANAQDVKGMLKDPFDIEDANEENSESKPIKCEPNIKKGDRTREKSLAEEELKDAIRTTESEYKGAVAQCAGQVADTLANYFVEAVLKVIKKEAKEAIAKSQLDASSAAHYKKNWDSARNGAIIAKEKARKRTEKAKKEIADLEADNDERDIRIADLEVENGAKDAKIVELEARIEAMNSA